MTSSVSVALRNALVAGAISALAGCGSGGGEPETASRSTDRPSTTTTTVAAQPEPPFAVGMHTETLVDTTRATPANGDYAGSPTRTLDTVIMYPAQGAATSKEPLTDAAPVDASFPLIVYAHGFSGGYESPYLREWASAGYIVAAPSFPLTRYDAPGGPSYVDDTNEPADVSFVISQMLNAPVAVAGTPLTSEASEIGVVGASLGATISLALVANEKYEDGRIVAAVAIAGGCLGCPTGAEVPGDAYFTGDPRPLLIIHGTADPFVPYDQSVQLFADAPEPKFFVTLQGAGHITFDEPWESIAVASMIDFFDEYLKHDDSGLEQLPIDANVAGTASLEAAPAS